MNPPTVKSKSTSSSKKAPTPPDVTSAPGGEPPIEPPTASETTDADNRVLQANAIIHRNVLWTLGAGVVPVPIFDIVAIVGVQLKMLRELSQLYGLKFSEGIAKKAVASLLAGLGGVGIGTAIAPSLIKFIPVVGSAIGAVSVSVVSGAFTHAVGRVFVMHFESGGTILDFDARAMRGYFKTEFEKAKETVSSMKPEQSQAGTA